MKTIITCFLFVALVAACSKQAKIKRAKMPASNQSASSQLAEPRTTAVASGDMRALLLQLQRVHFAFDSTTLLPEARSSLQAAAELLIANPNVSLFLDGHTDLRGTTEYNVALGDRRAQTVLDYLVRLGIDPARLQTVSFGPTRPLRDGSDPTAHALNRRVEFRVMHGDLELVLENGTPFDDRGTALVAENQ
jgi:peptidoglycan-associated lipoprotein